MKRELIIALTTLTVTAGAALAGPVQTVNSELGEVLAAQNGKSLYTFRNDTKNQSNCYDGCAANWPPFMAKAGAKAEGDLGLVKRNDGTMQWALNGKPLYFWVGDEVQGDVTGDGVGGVWDVVRK